MLTLPPPPGFRGLGSDLPVEIARRHLPHWRQDGATYFVTFRTADSIPASRAKDLQLLQHELAAAQDDPAERERIVEASGKLARLMNVVLDESHGECPLRDPALAEIVGGALRYFDGDRYRLFAHTVMPNHVHLLVCPNEGHALGAILKSWKHHTSLRLNAARETKGRFWQADSYHRIVHNAEELYRIVRYIDNNGAKAGLSDGEYSRWICPEWVAAGWGFDT